MTKLTLKKTGRRLDHYDVIADASVVGIVIVHSPVFAVNGRFLPGLVRTKF
jgi:hypothetical protein